MKNLICSFLGHKHEKGCIITMQRVPDFDWKKKRCFYVKGEHFCARCGKSLYFSKTEGLWSSEIVTKFRNDR
ncbi:MAG: hypothetical protein LBS50_10965 [Prevotellaceae bacterium]|jgi:hypothetical protein|nr:hypothetical protein [Prevotellaceae bacterium]